jgi:hypothetical protein
MSCSISTIAKNSEHGYEKQYMRYCSNRNYRCKFTLYSRTTLKQAKENNQDTILTLAWLLAWGYNGRHELVLPR